MLPADFEQWLANREREIKQPPPEAPRKPGRITRNQSANMRIANRQTPNLTRAIYVPESDRNQTPLLPSGTCTTRSPGLGQGKGSQMSGWGAKATGAVQPSDRTKGTPRKNGGGRRNTRIDWDALMKEYE